MYDPQDEKLKTNTNNFIIKNKKLLKKNVLNTLRCNIKKMSSRIEKNPKIANKFQSKIENMNKEMTFIKEFDIVEVMKFAIINKRTFKEIIADPSCTSEQRALYRYISHTSVEKCISNFLANYPKMKDNLFAASIIFGIAPKKKSVNTTTSKQLKKGQNLHRWLDSYAKLPRTSVLSDIIKAKEASRKIKSSKIVKEEISTPNIEKKVKQHTKLKPRSDIISVRKLGDGVTKFTPSKKKRKINNLPDDESSEDEDINKPLDKTFFAAVKYEGGSDDDIDEEKIYRKAYKRRKNNGNDKSLFNSDKYFRRNVFRPNDIA